MGNFFKKFISFGSENTIDSYLKLKIPHPTTPNEFLALNTDLFGTNQIIKYAFYDFTAPKSKSLVSGSSILQIIQIFLIKLSVPCTDNAKNILTIALPIYVIWIKKEICKGRNSEKFTLYKKAIENCVDKAKGVFLNKAYHYYQNLAVQKVFA